MPKISVIIPVYKVEDTLHRCVDSVLRQTFTDFEIILVDDGSPDNCPKICDAYKEKNDQVKVIHQPNGGLSNARNTGLSIARGSYVMFLDSDDYLTDDALEKLSGRDADLVVGSIYKQTADRTFHEQPPRKSEYIERERFGDMIPVLLSEKRINYVHGKLYRRRIITDNGLLFEDDMLTSAEDTVFNFTFLKYCSSIYVTADHVHYYMFNAKGLARRFYPDRYERSRRLNRFMMSVSDEIGIVTEDQKRALYRYRVAGAVFSLRHSFLKQALSRKELLTYTETICTDEELRYALEKAGADEPIGDELLYNDLLYLLEHGSRAFIRRMKRQERRAQLKRMRSTLLMYPREALYRMHILKR